MTVASSDAGNDTKLSRGAAVGVGVGVGVVSVILLGILLMWMYRKGKKAAAIQTNKDLKQDGFVDHWVGDMNTGRRSPHRSMDLSLNVVGVATTTLSFTTGRCTASLLLLRGRSSIPNT